MSSSLFFRHWLLSLDQLALDGVLDPPPAQQQNETIAGGVGCHPSPLLFVSPSYTSKTHRHTPYLTPTHYETVPWTHALFCRGHETFTGLLLLRTLWEQNNPLPSSKSTQPSNSYGFDGAWWKLSRSLNHENTRGPLGVSIWSCTLIG